MYFKAPVFTGAFFLLFSFNMLKYKGQIWIFIKKIKSGL